MLSDTELCCVFIAVGVGLKKKKKTGRKGGKWAKQWFIDREKYTHENLLNELRIIEPNDFRNFLLIPLLSPTLQN
ncbi:hypothetical protein WN55_10891 [Dufourea novaeangliae]|uniref:Uncharacterized protein n=1 Tax=Dufourea novaeangliae TaxID=178035 RepID=A0A154P9G6_DUFNO|nr:hypothetical protein WN55_10891 [Dufourea novaeangliae]